MKHLHATLFAVAFAFVAFTALADPIQIEAVEARLSGEQWNFSVTLRHADGGWDHYADGWEILSPDGTVFGYRELLHPHVNEQPFTRSLGGVHIPADQKSIAVRAHCSVDGWVGEPFELTLNR